MRFLFVCSMNRLRSPTAEAVFSEYEGVEARSAGVSQGAEARLSSEDIAWADVVFVMEKGHRRRVREMYPKELKGKKLICLDIKDEYEYMDEELVELLKSRVGPWVENG